MSHNMSIYRQLNPRLLVQARLGLSLLHWARVYYIGLICLIYISNTSESLKSLMWLFSCELRPSRITRHYNKLELFQRIFIHSHLKMLIKPLVSTFVLNC